MKTWLFSSAINNVDTSCDLCNFLEETTQHGQCDIVSKVLLIPPSLL